MSKATTPEDEEELKRKKAETADATQEMSMFSRNLLKNADGGGPSLWLITFADIIALMLTFFVLLYSMSVPQEEKWEELTNSVAKGFSKFYSPPTFQGTQDTISIEKLDFSEALNLDYLKILLEEKIAETKILKDISLIPQSDRLIISLPQSLLFDGGNDEVNARGKRALFALGGILQRIRNRVEVIGHTDPRPIQNTAGKFSSNWELSLARAVQVSNILLQVGYSRDVKVKGLSSARYDELSDQLNEEQRQSLSRRVDIVIMEDDGSNRVFLNINSF